MADTQTSSLSESKRQPSTKGYRPPITSWRAFVNCEQIGYRFPTKAEASEAARKFIETRAEAGMPSPVVVIRPSYSPVNGHDVDTPPAAGLATP